MRPTRVAITLLFFADGILLGSWAARVPAVQRQAGLTNGRLSIALFAMSLGALVAMPVAGWLCTRIGSRRVLVGSLAGGSAALVAASFATGLGGLAASLAAFGGGFGATNVSANVQGLALEHRYGRSILSSFHAAFSTGGLLGAGLGALVAAAGVGTRVHLVAVALVLAPVAVALGRLLLPPDPGDPARPVFVRPPRVLLVLGAAAYCTLLAEGAAADWSAVYLSRSLGATAALAALGYAGFSLAMAASRAGGSTPGVSPGVGIAAVSLIGWLGFLSGPPAIGLAAGAVGLRAALGLVVLAAVGLALLARAARPRGARDYRRTVTYTDRGVGPSNSQRNTA